MEEYMDTTELNKLELLSIFNNLKYNDHKRNCNNSNPIILEGNKQFKIKTNNINK